MTYILHIESASSVCSIAISKDGQCLHCEASYSNDHIQQIPHLVKLCLKASEINMQDLDAISVSKGPGSYTSLRTGYAYAKACCYAQQIPLIEVETTKAIARSISLTPNLKKILVLMDARNNNAYYAMYSKALDTLHADAFGEIQEIISKYKNEETLLCGNVALPDSINIEFSSRNHCEIAYTYYMNKIFADLVMSIPNYIRDPNITKAKKKI